MEINLQKAWNMHKPDILRKNTLSKHNCAKPKLKGLEYELDGKN